MSKGEVFKEWEKNTMRINIRAHCEYDADIIQALSRAMKNGEAKSTAAKRLLRLGIQAEHEQQKQ